MPLVLGKFCIARYCTVPRCMAPSVAGPGFLLDGLLLGPEMRCPAEPSTWATWPALPRGRWKQHVRNILLRGMVLGTEEHLGEVAVHVQQSTSCPSSFLSLPWLLCCRRAFCSLFPCFLSGQSSFAINSPIFPFTCHRLPFISEMGTAGRIHESSLGLVCPESPEGFSGA